MDIPADWLSEAKLAAAIGVSDDDRSKFHRNLLNWRHSGLLPGYCHGLQVPSIRYLGVGIGNEAVYPPITIPILCRIDELRHQSRNMDVWLWQLWLEGYPIDIIEWCRPRLQRYVEIISGIDRKQLVKDATRKPAKRADLRHAFYRRLKARWWVAMMTWAAEVAVGARPIQSIFDPFSSPLSGLTRLFGGSPADHSAMRGQLEGSPIEEFGLAGLLAVLNDAQPAELERAREDFWVLSNAHRVRSVFAMILSSMWRRVDYRAIVLPMLVKLHRSPDHRTSILEAVNRHLNDGMKLSIPHARG